MVKETRENAAAGGGERAPVTLPDELAKWAGQNQELLERVQNALPEAHDTLTEEQLWGAIAAAFSPEWQEAQASLQKAEDRWADLNSPENTSLGLIGNALDSDENNAARTQYAFSLAYFTIVNEGLRQREDLSKLLKVMLVQKRMLERSAEQAQQLQKATARLTAASTQDSAFIAAKNQKTAAEASIEKTRTLTGPRGAFKQYADKLKPKKSQTPKNAPAPSSPKT